MPKCMIQASYTGDGTKGVMNEGGTKRRATVEANVKAAGGTVEAFYFAFGDADALSLLIFPTIPLRQHSRWRSTPAALSA
jgi:uncharacterized protein with GYD domain